MLHQTSDLLARLTHYAAVVVGPRPEVATDPQRPARAACRSTAATVVLVLGNGTVENAIVEIDDTSATTRLSAASAHLAAQSVGRHAGRSRVDAAVRRRGRRRPVRDARSAPSAPGSPTTTCTSAARRRWPRRSTRSTSCGRCCTRWSSSSWSCRSCATSSTAACPWRSASSTASSRCRPARSSSRRSWSTASSVGSVGVLGPTRMNYPQALATVEVVERPARPPARRRGSRLMADYYELLGVDAGRRRADDLKKAYRQKAARAAPRRQPRRPAGRGALQGGRPGLRRALRRRAARPLRPLRRGRRRRPVRRSRTWTTCSAAAAWATSSRRSSAAANPFGGGRRGPSGPPRGQDMEVVVTITFEQAVFGDQIPVDVRTAAALRPSAAAPAPARARSRSRAPSAAARARSGGSARACSARWSSSSPCPRCGGLGQVVVTPCPKCRRRGPDHARQDVHRSTCRPASTRLDAAPHRGRGAGRAARRRQRRPLRAPPRAGPRALFAAIGDDLVHRRADLDRPGRARHQDRAGDARRRRGAVVHAGTQPGHEFVLRGPRRAAPARAAGEATCGRSCGSRCRPSCRARKSDLLRQYAELRGESVAEPGGLFSKIKSAFS